MKQEVACQNCAWIGVMDKCNPIEDIFERVAPGDEMPAGECPICGALAHIIDEDEEVPYFDRVEEY